MEKRKIIFTLLVLFGFAFATTAVTFDELLRSYDFTYDDGSLVVNDFNLNSNASHLFLDLNLTSLEGNYEFRAAFYSEERSTAFRQSDFLGLENGENFVNLSYDVRDLNESNYVIQIEVLRNDFVVYRNLNFSSIFIGFDSFNLEPKIVNFHSLLNDSRDLIFFEKEIFPAYLPDLEVLNFNYMNCSGKLNFTLINNAEHVSTGFVIRVIDDDFNDVFVDVISFLKPFEIEDYNMIIESNHTRLILYLDYFDDVIELNESNNVKVWRRTY